jgi:hypothetical protein
VSQACCLSYQKSTSEVGVSSVCCGPKSRARPNPGLVDCSVVELPVLTPEGLFVFLVPGSRLQVPGSKLRAVVP